MSKPTTFYEDPQTPITSKIKAVIGEKAEIESAAVTATHKVLETADRAAHALIESTKKDIEYIKESIAKIEKQLDQKFVTKEEFEPVKRIVDRVTWLVVASAVIGLLALVIKK